MTRVIDGLVWARTCQPPPMFAGKRRSRGAKAQGLRYERALAKALPTAVHGQWFEFKDRRGAGWCQPDLLLAVAGGLLVLEAKYTWILEGHLQIEKLYRPVVAKASGKRVFGLVVCKVLVPEALDSGAVITGDWQKAVDIATAGGRVVLQWLPKAPLAPSCAIRPRVTAAPLAPETLGL